MNTPDNPIFNYRLTIMYDGGKFHGWQIQKNADTIQQVITEAIEMLTHENINLIGAGRTDTGVHALGQVANFQTARMLDIYRFIHSLNGILPESISIIHCEQVPPSFHSRFDAKARVYQYRICKRKNPFQRDRSFFYPRQLDIQQLNEWSKAFLGSKDFFAFCKEAPENGNTVCAVTNFEWRLTDYGAEIEIEADRFLHNMVRLMIGALIRLQEKKIHPDDIQHLLEHKTDTKWNFSVPACGLYLYKVKY